VTRISAVRGLRSERTAGRLRSPGHPTAAVSVGAHHRLQGSAPARTSLYVVVSGGDVTARQGGGIMVCKEERALIVPNCGFGDRTKHALGQVLAAPLTGPSNYRLERP
jgi:hypothetical protein